MPYSSGARQASPSPPIRPLPKGAGPISSPRRTKAEFVGWWRENDKRHGQQALRESRCERVAMVSAGVGMCGGLRRRALTFHSGVGSEICIQSEERAELVAAAWARGTPGARNGRRFVQGKAGPIVFRVGMFGYVRFPYVRYFCWSQARPQMLPDRGLPIFVGRLLSTPGPRFCVAKSGAGLRVGFPLYMTPRARSDTRFLRYALTD